MPEWRAPNGSGVTSRWLLVRHGEVAAEARGRCYGKLEVGLSEIGRRQIEQLGSILAPAAVATIHSSPLRRARESAELLGNSWGCPVEIEARFSELDFGELEGKTYEEIREVFPELYQNWMTDPTSTVFPGGESFADMRERVITAAEELRARHRGGTNMILGHGGVCRVLLAEALGMPRRHLFRLGLDYSNVNVIDYFDEVPVIQLMNWTPGRVEGWRGGP